MDDGAKLRRRTDQEVIALIAHEIRSPLCAIKLATEQLLEPEVDAETRARLLACIARSVARADRLVDDLIDRA